MAEVVRGRKGEPLCMQLMGGSLLVVGDDAGRRGGEVEGGSLCPSHV